MERGFISSLKPPAELFLRPLCIVTAPQLRFFMGPSIRPDEPRIPAPAPPGKSDNCAKAGLTSARSNLNRQGAKTQRFDTDRANSSLPCRAVSRSVGEGGSLQHLLPLRWPIPPSCRMIKISAPGCNAITLNTQLSTNNQLLLPPGQSEEGSKCGIGRCRPLCFKRNPLPDRRIRVERISIGRARW